jgi:hypothetical protein
VADRLPGLSGRLVISASPAGFTFCLVRWHGESTVPGPVRLDGGGASRADAFWLDVPEGGFERERSFWAALTGWEGQTRDRSALPVRLELRRVGAWRRRAGIKGNADDIPFGS